MADDTFSAETTKQAKGGSGCTTAIIGCLIVLLILAALACGLGYYAYVNMGVWVTNFLEEMLVQVIDESELPPEQKEGMKKQISRVATAYRDGDITFEQVTQIGEKLGQSPVFMAIAVETAKFSYINPSGLSDEEKAEATKQLNRVAHGTFEKKINEEELQDLMDGRIADRGPDGNLEFREKVSDDQLRELIDASRQLADDKGIPDENFKVDLAAELKKAVDEVLNRRVADTPDVEIPEQPAVPEDAMPMGEPEPDNATEEAVPVGAPE